jgi:hypothetical protein
MRMDAVSVGMASSYPAHYFKRKQRNFIQKACETLYYQGSLNASRFWPETIAIYCFP